MKKKIFGILKIFVGVILMFLCVGVVTVTAKDLEVSSGELTGNGYFIDNEQSLDYEPAYRRTTDQSHHILLVNGEIAFCLEPGVRINDTQSANTSDKVLHSNEMMSEIDFERMAWISYFGYNSPYVNHTDLKYYDATQDLVWHTVYPELGIYWYTGESDDVDYWKNHDTNDVKGAIQEIENLITEAKKAPNISAPSKNITVGEVVTFSGDYSTDKYKVTLSSATDATIVSQDSSGLSIRVNTTNPVQVTVTKVFKGANDINSVVYNDAQYQDLISLGLNIPKVSKTITLNAIGGNIQIVKTSSKASGLLGDSTLKGAVYTVKYSGDAKYADFELVTDDKGIATTIGTVHEGLLPVGTYTIKEKTPSKGYLLDTKTYTVTITDSNYSTVQRVNSLEELIEAKIQIVKVEASGKTGILKPEANKVFKLYPLFGDDQDKEVATLTTDSDGFAITGNIPYGKYVLRQVEPFGTSEAIGPITIEINDSSNGKTLKYVLANAPYSARLKVIKLDKDTGEVITRGTAKFKIKWLQDENGEDINEYITQVVTLSTGKKKTLEYFETDEDGILITPESLKPGKYQLEEIEAPDGYELNEEVIEFVIAPNQEGIEVDDEYGMLLTIEVTNEKKPEEPENPPTFDSTSYLIVGGLVALSIGVISYINLRKTHE